MSEKEEDLILMFKIIQQNQEALSALYDRYGAKVYGLAMYTLQHRELAEEVTQDVFLKVWDRAQSWDPQKGKLVSWLLTITRRQAIDVLRREKRTVQLTLTPVDDLTFLASEGEGRDPTGWMAKPMVQNLLGELDENQRQAIWLAYFQGLSHQEIADRLQWPLGTVKTRLRAAMKRLRDAVQTMTEMPNE